MKRLLILGAALAALAGCSVQAQAPGGYLGYVFALYHGRVVLAGGIRQLGLSRTDCEAAVGQAVRAAEAQARAQGAPADIVFTGQCYAIPGATVSGVISQRAPAAGAASSDTQTL